MSTPDNSLSAVLKGTKQTANWLKHQRAAHVKAHKTAVKVEGFRLKNKLQAEIRKGAPGGKPFAPLSFIARRLWIKNRPGRAPLARLAYGIRYNVQDRPFEMKVGFVQPTRGPQSVSKAWRRIAAHHQEGFVRDVTERQRRYFAGRGAELFAGRGAERDEVGDGDTPFFLRKSTRRLTTPAREIVRPFWRANAGAAEKNIRNNFKKKMKGQRI